SGLVAALGTVVCWFRTGRCYARGALGVFVREAARAEMGQSWTHQNTGAGGPTYQIMRALEVVVVDVAHALGGTDALAERLLFALMFAIAATGVAAFVARLVHPPRLIVAAGGS